MTLFDEYFRQRSDLIEADKRPIEVVFNEEGYTRARSEQNATTAFNYGVSSPPTTYCGLPFRVERSQTAEMIVNGGPS